ncbi:uncharacterized protein LOC62_03G003549 [Vanrija pseudolonga]|uniref:Uncharacterized protein n=1 Tax=Vanrija pseudolonga TaxID=143232 RepID=A0AAF1BGP3_9TREE|nr:hypothetical protein LOC62_03G003549 [Vanrija pseudolonga]
MPDWNLDCNTSLMRSGTADCEYEDIFIWLSGLARGVVDAQYMCDECCYFGDACWHFFNITGITEAAYCAHLTAFHCTSEAEKPMNIFRRVRAWQIRQGM